MSYYRINDLNVKKTVKKRIDPRIMFDVLMENPPLWFAIGCLITYILMRW